MIKKKIFGPTDLCPCHSGWMVVSCCFDPDDRQFRKKVKSIEPPRPISNYSHPKCYLSNASDCSEDISHEHYFSASLLRQLGDEGVEVLGLPWLKAGESRRYSINNLTAKILCKRHNEALSPLDAEAGIFFRELTASLEKLQRKSSSKKADYFLVSGTALELWALKTACGLYFSKAGAHDGERLAKTHSIDMEKIEGAFFGVWDDRSGLYFNGRTGSTFMLKAGLQFSPLSKGGLLCGARISLHGIEFDLVFDTSRANPEQWKGLTRRPTELIFERGGRDQRIILTWPTGTREVSVVFSETTLDNSQKMAADNSEFYKLS